MDVTITQFSEKEIFIKGTNPDTTVAQIKTQIQTLEKIHVDNQLLLSSENILNDGLQVSQLPSVETERCPEITGPLSKKERIINLKICQQQVKLSICLMAHGPKQFPINAYLSQSIKSIKALIEQKSGVPSESQVLTFDKKPLENTSILCQELLKLDKLEVVNLNSTHKLTKQGQVEFINIKESYELSLVVKLVNPGKPLSLGIDFSFNNLRNVHRVNWQEDAPNFRQAQDGLNWVVYCKNKSCLAYKQMVILSRGFKIFFLQTEINNMVCPLCEKKEIDIRNMAFVNCEWAIRGKLKRNPDSRIAADGKTYDNKFYTFKETNYVEVFDELHIKTEALKNVKFQNCSEYEPSAISSRSSNQQNASSRQFLKKTDKQLAKQPEEEKENGKFNQKGYRQAQQNVDYNDSGSKCNFKALCNCEQVADSQREEKEKDNCTIF